MEPHHRFNDIDPLSLLSKGAKAIVDSGRCDCAYRDLKEIFEMNEFKRAALSERIERNTGDSMRYCIEDIKEVPVTTPVARNNAIKELAESHASKIDSAFTFPMDHHLKEFAEPHGATKDVEYQEVLDAWTEARSAWEIFRSRTVKFSERR